MSKNKRTALRAVFIAYCAVLVFLSVYPIPSPKVATLPLDKIVHAGAYLVLGALAVGVFLTMRLSHVLVRAFVFTLGFGILIECVQYFLPYRSFDVLDIACNVAGSLAGILIVFFSRKRSVTVT